VHIYNIHENRRERFVLRTVEIKVEGLPSAFKGFRIAQLTDLHYGPATSAKHLEAAVKLTNSLGPDLIVLTGDYIQNSRLGIRHRLATDVNPKLFGLMNQRRAVRQLANDLGTILEPLEAPKGIVGVFGNHDYIEGIGSIRKRLPQRINWLVNSAQQMRSQEGSLLIAGVDDTRRGTPNLEHTVQSAIAELRGCPEPFFKILLSHNPDVVLERSRHLLTEFDLILCGHTHGGQIRLPMLGAPITRTKQRHHTSLLSDFHDSKIYVNHGVGYGGITVRLFCPPEITIFEFQEL
jgi:predicted MPP superfamily phosphohydrolase